MVDSLDEFWNSYISYAFKKSNDGRELLFRGVSDKSYQLIPSIGRDTEKNTNGDIETVEFDLLEEFKRLSAPILSIGETPKSDFDWLFLAQHYGLPTRLLDWTTNPLVALYFAVEKDDHIDAGVYALRHMVTDQYHLFDYKTADYTLSKKREPSSVLAIQPNQRKVIFVRPKYLDQRYRNQCSVFSCPCNPFKHLEGELIEFIPLKGDWKLELRKRLKTMGISTSFIYPGLAGIALEIKSFLHEPISSGRMQVFTCRAEIKLPQL